jgi:hypothetical protein
MKTLDLTGQRFGRLVAVKRAEKRKWLFRCDCGEEKAIASFNVKNGTTTSCGCYRRETAKASTAKLDMLGQRFGELVVIASAGVGGDHGQRLLWECRCDCGSICVATGKNLRSGNTKTCGHGRTLGDLTGQAFSRLTVAALDHREGTLRFWQCLCECGKTAIVQTRSLVSGNTKSCGCLKSDTAVANFRNEGHEAYALNPDYANRPSWVYLVEVAKTVDKIGIAFDMHRRAKTGDYTEIWWKRRLTRAQAWAVEQVSLHLTECYRPQVAYDNEHGKAGPSEQRTGWALDEIIAMLEELCDECLRDGWEDFYSRYFQAVAA